MKLTKQQQLNLLTKSGSLRKDVANAIHSSRIIGSKIYPKYYTGSGRYINLKDYSFHIIQILKMKGYKFEQGNDAPRGGKEGDFIKVSKTALKFIKDLTLNY